MNGPVTLRFWGAVGTVTGSRFLLPTSKSALPKIIIAGSGMATGGRVLHHLKVYGPESRNTILFAGYQAGGTRGAALLAGARELRIHGQQWPVRAEVSSLDMLSAHADGEEIVEWMATSNARQRRPSSCTVNRMRPRP